MVHSFSGKKKKNSMMYNDLDNVIEQPRLLKMWLVKLTLPPDAVK